MDAVAKGSGQVCGHCRESQGSILLLPTPNLGPHSAIMMPVLAIICRPTPSRPILAILEPTPTKEPAGLPAEYFHIGRTGGSGKIFHRLMSHAEIQECPHD